MAEPSPWDTSGTANSLADAIRRQAEAQSQGAAKAKAKKAGVSASPANPLEQLMQQIQGIRVEETPLSSLMSQATGMAGSQFDPLIEQLKGEMARTEKRGKSNQGEARAMYNALGSDIAGQAPEIAAQLDAASQETEGRYNQTQVDLQGGYNQQAQQQAELLKQLGIQAAAPAASQQATDDQAYFQQQSQSEENSALAQLMQMKNTDLSYNRQSADNTRLAGNNVASDIGAQLEDYMQTAGSKMSGLQSGRESAISGMLEQLKMQDAQRVEQSEGTEYDRLMDMFNLQLKMQEMAGKQAKDSAMSPLFKGTNGPAGAANYLGGVYGQGDTFTSDAIMELVNGVMGSEEAVTGKFTNDTMKDSMGAPMVMDTTPDYLIRMLRERMTKGDPENPLASPSFGTADMNHAINTLLAQMGKLK